MEIKLQKMGVGMTSKLTYCILIKNS